MSTTEALQLAEECKQYALALFGNGDARSDLRGLQEAIERLAALAAAAPSPADPWQLIDGAPKNGKPVLLYELSHGRETMLVGHIARFPKQQWVIEGGFPMHPTHYMPLPAAPGAHPAPTEAAGLIAALTPEYMVAIRDLAQKQDMSERAVLRAAIRLYQAERLGTVSIEFKREMSMLAPTLADNPAAPMLNGLTASETAETASVAGLTDGQPLDPLQSIDASAARMQDGIEKLRTGDTSDLDPELLAMAEKVVAKLPGGTICGTAVTYSHTLPVAQGEVPNPGAFQTQFPVGFKNRGDSTFKGGSGLVGGEVTAEPSAGWPSIGDQRLESLRQMASSWLAVCRVLDEIDPEWSAREHASRLEQACNAIRGLAAALASTENRIDRLETELAQARAAVPTMLPHPGLPEVSAALDAVLAEYNYPANPKNAARAGWTAATRWIAAAPNPPAQPAAVQEPAGEDRMDWATAANWLHAAYDRPPQTPESKAMLAAVDALARVAPEAVTPSEPPARNAELSDERVRALWQEWIHGGDDRNLIGFVRHLLSTASSADARDGAPYLKDGESVVECLQRNQRDVSGMLSLLASERRRVQELEAKLNTPELHDFTAGVVLEAAHQRERWGAKHDVGKAPADWFWLLGYLVSKALNAHIDGNTDKALHHTISSAAALANWHAAISGTNTAMRPGIDPVARGIEDAAIAAVQAPRGST